MAGLITGPFAAYLEANRDQLNQRVIAATRQASAFDAAAFAAVLVELVVPIVDAVDAQGDGFVNVVSETLFEIALDLSVQRRFDGAIRDGWTRLLPQLAALIVADPRGVIGAVTNALDSLARARGARPGQWIDLVAAAARVAPTPAVLLRAGQVAAWRSGMAGYRGDALAIATTLEPAVVAAALGLAPTTTEADAPAEVAAIVSRLQTDPWFDPASAAATGATRSVGSFRGFGGDFLRPPTILAASPMRVLVTDGEDRWFVFADAFGSAVVRTNAADDQSAGAWPAEEGSGEPPPELADVAELTTWIRTPTALVATSALTHAVLFRAAS